MREIKIPKTRGLFLAPRLIRECLFVLITSLLITILSLKINAQENDSLAVEDMLKMSITDLMNIEVVSASKVYQQIKDVSATVHVITSDQIKERGYFTLEEALSDLPGFQFRNIVGFNSYVFMRGAPSQNNLILLLVDGVQINELNSGGFYGGGQFNLSDVDRIEIVYGPASALYGTNAMSGIINIITKESDETNSGFVSLLGGNFNTAMVDFNIKNYKKENTLNYSFSGMHKTTEKADLRGAKGDYNWTDNMENFESDLSFSGKLGYKDFKAGFVFQEKRASYTTNFKSIGEIFFDRNSLWDISFLNGYLKYTNDKSDDWKFNSMLYYRNTTVKPNTIADIVKSSDTSTGYQIGYYRPNQLFGFENQLNFNPLEDLLIIGGFIAEVEQLSEGFSITKSNSQDTKPPKPEKPNQLTNELFSIFFQVQYSVFEQLSFVGGLRQDFSSYYGEVLTPRIGFIFNESNFSAKLLYDEAFRAPKPWDYNYGLGNKNLIPEKMRSIELAVTYFAMDNLSIGCSIYKNLIQDKYTKEVEELGDRWVNKDELNTLGLELFGNYIMKSFTLYANYTFTDSYDKDELNTREISRHTANAGITYSYNQHFKINFRTNYIGKRNTPAIIQTTQSYVIDDAILLHGCVSYFDLWGVDFQLKINNILNKEYYHPSNRFAGRYRQPQRTFTFKISYNL
jgi:outer membrane cobalamin receptor